MPLKNPTEKPCACLPQREFGILAHVTSLPGPGCGDLGPDAYRFIDFVSACGARVWQVLPLVPTHASGSPYHGQSVHAGNPLLISVQQLHEDGLFSAEQLQLYRDQVREGAGQQETHYSVLNQLFHNHFRTCPVIRQEITSFKKTNSHWLLDYALYVVIKCDHDGAPWYEWPRPLRDRDPEALAEVRAEHRESIDIVNFQQYLFWRQWLRLKAYANRKGIRIMGDMPIFPAHDSAEVWACPQYFQLHADGRAINVAGVPPDYFSATGQYWGNPLYDWKRLREDDFGWWVERVCLQLQYFDLLRVDHFRGFEAYWSIPAGSVDATAGHWSKAPGAAFFKALQKRCGPPALIAEDLGYITQEVEDLRRRFGFPGMRVLQFAFDGESKNPHSPHNHDACSVVYTGTHDNQTAMGWYQDLDPGRQQQINEYLGMPQEPMPWILTRVAMASVARLAVMPMQDVMGLDDSARMNTPGTENGNWGWQFSWDEIPDGCVERLRHLAAVYERLPDS